MNVHESDITDYMKANEDIYTCTLEGKKYIMYVDPDKGLQLMHLPGYFLSFGSGKSLFVPANAAEHLEIVVDFPTDLIEKIKESALERNIKDNLARLLPAAREMIKHYSGHDADGIVRQLNPYIRMYVLKDIDFAQSGKGYAVICPTSDGATPDRDFIKGYIYCAEHDSIKFETVQAWRYRKVGGPAFVFGSVATIEWVELMTAKQY